VNAYDKIEIFNEFGGLLFMMREFRKKKAVAVILYRRKDVINV